MTDGTSKRVTVIIPNFNGMKYLPACIASLRAQDTDDFEILVVDNGSADGCVNWLKQEGIWHIALETNTGFSGGVNAGIRASSSEYVLLLNNDTVCEPDFIRVLTKAIDRNRKLFAVNPMMIKAQDREKLDSAGDGISIFGWAYQRGLDEPAARYGRSRDIFSACAGASIYRRSAFDRIGLFDEMHFAYLEDIDVSWRARLAGYFNSYCPDAKVYHFGSATTGSKYNSFKVFLSTRNNIYLQVKNQPLPQLLINLPWLIAGIIIKAVFFTRLGFGSDYVSGLKEGITDIPKLKKAQPARGGFVTYAALEWEMLAGTVEYFVSYARRH